MNCRHCGAKFCLEKIPFSAVCEKCGCWLHSCLQCALWDRNGSRCRSMTTEPVSDRNGKNFCEEWQPGREQAETPSDSSGADKFNSLFGE